MGATLSTYQLTVYKLTPDGQGGFWWMAKDSNDRAYQINYANANVESAAQLFHVDTFWDLMVAMNANSITLPLVEIKINVEDVATANGLNAQFESPMLTNNQIDLIAQGFNPVNLCKLFGVFALVRRFFIRGHLTLAQLRDVFLYLGVNNKIQKAKVEASVNWLLNNNNPATSQPWITQVQADAFWIDWTNQVGT